MSTEEFWKAFLHEKKLPAETKYYEAFCFGGSPECADYLLDLVLSGKKKATSSSLEGYEASGEKMPEAGDYSIITNAAGEPFCVIRTNRVTVLAFRDMTYEICKREGEDDCLESWRKNHIKFFTEDAKETGYIFSEDMGVVFEDFEVIYKKGELRNLEDIKNKKGFICDMDGVIYHGNRLLPGVKEFVDWLYKEDKKFLFLTNSPERSPKELQQKLARMGLDVDESHFYTSAEATAKFVSSQSPGSSAYVIGGAGLIMALHDAGITMNDVDPEYVIVGEGGAYNFENLCKAVNFVLKGAKLIGTNSDLTGPVEDGIAPACRSTISPIEMATGKKAYFIGKPNPLMMRTGLKILDIHSREAVMIGDRMDTDIVAGIETGVDTVLVLSGVTDRKGIVQFPYRPTCVLDGVGDIIK